MTVIDVHTHFIPRFAVEDARTNGLFGVKERDRWLVHPQGYRYPLAAEFLDRAAKLAQMDTLGIDIAVLSSAPPLFFYDEPADEAVDFARRSNDALADFVGGSDRLEGLASLPLQDPDSSAVELERAVAECGLRGAQIGTNRGATPLDARELEPVFAAADQLGVPVMLHPYYVGPKPGLDDFYLVNSIGNPLDTTIAAARLIHAGVLDRFRNLRVVLVHGGGFLPYQLGRLDHAFAVRPEPKVAIERPPGSYLDRFWFDTITHGDAALHFLSRLVGPERLVLGTDLPFDMADSQPVERLTRVGLDPGAAGSAAADLLGLEQRSPQREGVS